LKIRLAQTITGDGFCISTVFWPSRKRQALSVRAIRHRGSFLTPGLGEAYTPMLVGPDGIVYAINNATLFAVGMQPLKRKGQLLSD